MVRGRKKRRDSKPRKGGFYSLHSSGGEIRLGQVKKSVLGELTLGTEELYGKRTTNEKARKLPQKERKRALMGISIGGGK